MFRPDHAIQERLGVLIVEGQRHDVFVRSEADEDGTWHNAILFRRDSKLGPVETGIVGVEWHVPPGIALQRARELGEKERTELFYRALRPRPPLV